jgi:hypothetical protein
MNEESQTCAEREGRKTPLFSKTIRTEKRTYFFDVHSGSSSEDLYITITECKKCLTHSGYEYYERFKLFLYPEGIDEFSKGLTQLINFIHKKPKVIVRKNDLSKENQKIPDDSYKEHEEHNK